MRRRMTVLRGAVLVLAFLLTLSGCEALRRKFTRTKRRSAKQEAMIVTPRDYSEHPFPNDVMYQQNFTYWKAWNQEWVASLHDQDSRKKILSCGEQALVNLEKMASYLTQEKKERLEVHVAATRALQEDIEAHRSLLPSHYAAYRDRAQRLLRVINGNFDMHHVKDAIR